MAIKESRQYEVGDMVAVLISADKAISCKVLEKGTAETKSGSVVHFEDEQVIWKRGKNRKWPNFVHRAFRGEGVERVDTGVEG